MFTSPSSTAMRGHLIGAKMSEEMFLVKVVCSPRFGREVDTEEGNFTTIERWHLKFTEIITRLIYHVSTVSQ